MLDNILNLVVSGLNKAGITAFREFPDEKFVIGTSPFVCVGLLSVKSHSSGMGDYLGVYEKAGGDSTEIFGKRVELRLGLEIFSPFGKGSGEAACSKCGDAIRGMAGILPAGLRTLDMSFGELSADEELMTYRCLCELGCIAFLVAEDAGDDAEFLDFVLKGTVDNGY